MYQQYLDDLLAANNDIRTAIDLSPQEAAEGTTHVITLSSNQPCFDCGGGGTVEGLFLPKPCRSCRGQGIVPCQQQFTVSIPAGVPSGAVLSLRGQGRYGLFARSRGDLHIQVNIRPGAPVLRQQRVTPAPAPAVEPLFPPGAPTVATYQPTAQHQQPVAQQACPHQAPTVADVSQARSSSASSPPTHLGNYRILRQLGAGGCGSVYLGQHVRLQTYAALKVLQQITPQDERAFLREAQTLAGLKHPHILRVLDFGTEGVTPFLIMDYALGGSLKELHPRGSHLSLHMVLSYIRQIVPALQYAHDRGVIHRDVKPDNLLLDEQSTILLSDFGIAVEAHKTRSMVVEEPYGTARYIAPEQLRGHPRPQSDQYALAVVVYEWLCGQLPFEGGTAELIRQHLYVEPPPLRQVVPTIPLAVEQAILRALAKDPHQRFESVQAFAQALEDAALP